MKLSSIKLTTIHVLWKKKKFNFKRWEHRDEFFFGIRENLKLILRNVHAHAVCFFGIIFKNNKKENSYKTCSFNYVKLREGSEVTPHVGHVGTSVYFLCGLFFFFKFFFLMH